MSTVAAVPHMRTMAYRCLIMSCEIESLGMYAPKRHAHFYQGFLNGVHHRWRPADVDLALTSSALPREYHLKHRSVDSPTQSGPTILRNRGHKMELKTEGTLKLLELLSKRHVI